MAVFEGKSPAERNKIIAAILLGVLSFFALWFAFGPSLGGSKTVATSSPTPKPSVAPANRELGEVKMPSLGEQQLVYESTPIFYNPNIHIAPDPGRNIFAFYEPPKPCPECPTPTPKPTQEVTPVPEPSPPVLLTFVTPQSVYAGAKGFRLEASGDKFTPDVRLVFNGNELPTSFVNPQRIYADVPANLIAGEGNRTVIVQTPDRSLYSTQVIISVQPPPKPTFQYVGMIARKRYNNDTAYFIEQGKQTPTGWRLNDVVAGRFKLVNIDADKVVLEDVNLGFRHTVELFRPPAGSATTTGPTGRPGFPQPGGFTPYNPGNPSSTQGIPGIPDGIPRYVPPRGSSNSNRPVKRDVDDNDDDDDPDNN
jgi:hypothetical protein